MDEHSMRVTYVKIKFRMLCSSESLRSLIYNAFREAHVNVTKGPSQVKG